MQPINNVNNNVNPAPIGGGNAPEPKGSFFSKAMSALPLGKLKEMWIKQPTSQKKLLVVSAVVLALALAIISLLAFLFHQPFLILQLDTWRNFLSQAIGISGGLFSCWAYNHRRDRINGLMQRQRQQQIEAESAERMRSQRA